MPSPEKLKHKLLILKNLMKIANAILDTDRDIWMEGVTLYALSTILWMVGA